MLAVVPEHIGRYRVLDVIGEGGMGTVYKAEQREPLRRTVAIKVIKPGFDSRQVIARFESERQALARMDHPNIARVLDAGMTEAHRPYFVMEFVPGVPVTRFCDDNRLTITERLAVFVEICKAISHAHTKALIHRDIKSKNVLAFIQDGKPAVKVIDFGIAKAVTGDRLTDQTFNTSRGEIVGTYDSMSPEQVEGSPDIDTRTDVYSLGVLLYELLSGSKPFDSATLQQASDQEIRRIVREVEPPKPSARLTALGMESQRIATTRRTDTQILAAALREELEWIPLMAMRKERHRRYESVQQLQSDVENYLGGRALLAGPESRAYRLRKAVQRHRGAVIAAAAILLLLIGGIATTTWQAIRARQAQQLARMQQAEALQQAAIAQAVNQFQLDMLRAADPYQRLGEKVTVLEAARAAIKRLDEGQFKDQPLIEAAVRDTIGDTLRALSRYKEAEPVLRMALHLRRNTLSAKHADVAQSMNQLAILLQELEEFQESEQLFRDALKIRLEVLPPDHPDIATSMTNLGTLLRAAGTMEEVEQLYAEALRIRQNARPSNTSDIAQSLNNLAALLHDQGKFVEADARLRESLQITEQAFGPEHPRVAEILDNRGMNLLDQGDLGQARKLVDAALEIRRRKLPQAHPDIALGLMHLAKVLQRQGAPREAVECSREAVRIRAEAFGTDHARYAEALASLAALLHSLGNEHFAEADECFKQSLKIQDALERKDQRTYAATLANFGALLVDQGKTSDGELKISQALLIQEKILPESNAELAITIILQGKAMTKLDRLADAERCFERAAKLRQRVSADDELAAQGWHNLGVVLARQRKDSQAVESLQEALRIRKAKLGAQNPDTRSTASRLIQVLIRCNRTSDADALRSEYQLPTISPE
jgi:serine/threonine protein kinase/Tfp pilus assembly protein PilF